MNRLLTIYQRLNNLIARGRARVAFLLLPVRMGKNVKLFGSVATQNYGVMTLGSDVEFRGDPVAVRLVCQMRGSLEIGDGCAFGSGVTLSASAHMKVGHHVHFARQSAVVDQSVLTMSLPPRSNLSSTRPTIIDDLVWIGARAMILGGVHVGWGSVIAAESLVNADVPPLAIVAGVPAQVIGYLEREDVLARVEHAFVSLKPGR